MWLDSLDAVLIAFTRTIRVFVVLIKEAACVGSGSRVIQVSRVITPGWGVKLPVIAGA